MGLLDTVLWSFRWVFTGTTLVGTSLYGRKAPLGSFVATPLADGIVDYFRSRSLGLQRLEIFRWLVGTRRRSEHTYGRALRRCAVPLPLAVLLKFDISDSVGPIRHKFYSGQGLGCSSDLGGETTVGVAVMVSDDRTK
jgi:hypothetical protein